jgi:very-short-patch-repair endonuclease
MGKRQQSSPPNAGEVELAARSEDSSGGGDVECNCVIMKQRARKLRTEATDAERALWARLRRRQILGYKFRRQQPLGQYIVDFVCLEKRLIVEVDGSQHNEQQSYDAARTGWLESQGYRVLRFWNNEVLSEMASVIEAITQQLALGRC